MYDSWWYWKECGGESANSWLTCKGAVENWVPRDDVFPAGFAFKPDNLPLVLHNRWFSAINNTYIKNGFKDSFIAEPDVDFALPIKADVFVYLVRFTRTTLRSPAAPATTTLTALTPTPRAPRDPKPTDGEGEGVGHASLRAGLAHHGVGKNGRHQVQRYCGQFVASGDGRRRGIARHHYSVLHAAAAPHAREHKAPARHERARERRLPPWRE
jgi:hypothetical protein